MNPLLRTVAAALPALLFASAASAQSHVVVMGPPGAREALAEALRVELASRGTGVVTGDAPLGETRVARAASAQATARSGGAQAAVWTDVVDDGSGPVALVRVAPASDGDVREAPLAAGADARATALVAASLLAELLGPPEPPPAPRVDVTVHTTVDVQVGGGAPTTPAAAPPVTPRVPPAPRPAARPVMERPVAAPKRDLVGDVGVGLGATTFVNDASAEGGAFLRGTLGLTFGANLRLGLDVDVVGMWEHEAVDGFRWTGRLGPSLELVLPIGSVALRVGVHVRGLLSSTWQYTVGPGGSATETTLAGGVSVGGSVALGVPLRDGLALVVALEVDGMARDVRGRTPWVVPALVVGLAWS